MWKKKLAVLVALMMVGLLAACSTSSSSTDDPLTDTGDDYLGSIRVTVDPSIPDITVTPIANAVSNTDQTGGGTFTVTTDPASVNYVAPTITGDMKFEWSGTDALEKLSIRIIDAPGDAATATIDNDDECGGAALGAALPGCKPGIVYVGEEAVDGPETVIELDYNQYVTSMDDIPDNGSRVHRGQRVLCPLCGVETATWSMSENGGGGAYTFTAAIYGMLRPTDVYSDSRYSEDHTAIKIDTYKPLTSTAKYPQLDWAAPTNQVDQGEWFYATIWYDIAGDGRAGTGLCDQTKTGCGSCGATVATLDNDCWYYVEDLDNKNAFETAGYHSTFSSYYPLTTISGANYNTGYLFIGGGAWEITWDPAVLMTNDNMMGGALGDSNWYGSGSNEFWTQGASGTRLRSVYNTTHAKAAGFSVSGNASNFMNKALGSNDAMYDLGGGTLPQMPDWQDTDSGADQGDYNAAMISFKAIGNSGEGSAITVSPTNKTTVYVCVGNKTATYAGAICVNEAVSDNWPTWEGNVGIFEAIRGSYNEKIGWVCIN